MKRAFWSGNDIGAPDPIRHANTILVFGSNVKGIHGLGMALIAKDLWGAKILKGRGLTGQCYALPTKNLHQGFFEKETNITYHKTGYRSLSMDQIKTNIAELYETMRSMPDKRFIIHYKLGTKNLNGYSTHQLVKLFTEGFDVPINAVFHTTWKPYFR
ncbi:TPA: hypothetical protein I7730_00815 [Vibrio vulnificus]|uniref:Uncharacterized protein n=1 Tax=Vibrio vulnificus TaxID=672 RepID=A0A8H9K5M7_VIBVL|nr:hypothetical protein [Vibrio vulnificus]HAS8538341.1 hypothetical protein [Vibrio vulnificus]